MPILLGAKIGSSVLRQRFKCHGYWLHGLCLLAICGLLAYHFFAVCEYHTLPWHYQADQDAILGPQIILLLNDGDFTRLHHPGATTVASQSLVHRLLAPFHPGHRNVFRLFNLASLDEAVALLELVVQTGKVVAFLSTIALVIAVYFLIAEITDNWFVSFVYTGAIATSTGLVYPRNIASIRSEMQSVAFFVISALLCYLLLSRKKLSFVGFLAGFLGSGVLLGMAVWAKVQILPQTFMLLLALALVVLLGATHLKRRTFDTRMPIVNLGLALTSVVVFPYWTLVRPSFLTAEFVSRIGYLPDLQLYGGSIPESYVVGVGSVLLSLLVIACVLFLARNQIGERWTVRLFWLSCIANLLTLGAIVSTHVIMVPASVSWPGYFANTHHLVYVTLKNVTQGSLANTLDPSLFPFEKWHLLDALSNIWRMHDALGTVPGVNLLYVVAVASILCGVRLCLSSRECRSHYLLPLFAMAAGFVADVASSTRMAYYVMSYYAVYSIPFYGVGLATFAYLELRHLDFHWRFWQVWKAVPGVILLLGALFVFLHNGHLIAVDAAGCPSRSGGGDAAGRGWSLLRWNVPQFKAALDYALRFDPAWGGRQLTLEAPNVDWELIGDDDVVEAPSVPGVSVVRVGEDLAKNVAWIITEDNFTLPSDFGVGASTLSLWVKVVTWKLGGETVLFGDGDLYMGISLTAAGRDRFQPRGYFGGRTARVDSELSIEAGHWHHIILVGEPDLVRLYLDGQEVGKTRPVNASLATRSFGLFDISGSSCCGAKTFEIGRVSGWDIALTPEQIQDLFDGQSVTFSPRSSVPGFRKVLEERGLSRR